MKIFDLERHQTTIRKEILAGVTTFATMAYAIVVVPTILKDAGMPFGSTMIATVLIAGIASIVMGLVANYPFVLFSGFGMAAYFTYSTVLHSQISWQEGLGVLFLVAVLMLILWASNLREKVVDAIPLGLKLATTGGIGLFLVLIAFKNMKIVVPYAQTLMGLGNLLSPQTLLFGFGLVLISALKTWKISGAILIGVLANWILGLALGLVEWKGVMGWPTVGWETFFALDLKRAFSSDMMLTVFAFLIVYLFDSSGTLMGLAHHGRFVDEHGKLKRMKRVLFPDGFGTLLASLFGSAATVSYIESGAGIAAGGRTGLTSVVAGVLFLVAFFFEPLASSIPFFAVAPALVVVGALMLRPIVEFRWDDPSDLIPAYATLVAIPYTFSIGIGIGIGVILYPLCKLCAGKPREVKPLLWLLAILFGFKFAVGA